MNGRQAEIHTMLPGIIESVDLTKMTCTVQPAVQATVTNDAGGRENANLPIATDVPIVFLNGGGYTATFPVSPGDECLLIFAERCIDNWWQEGGVQSQFEHRMHDLSDAFALVGGFSQPKRISNISASTVQLRSNDGTLFVEIDKSKSIIRLITPNNTVTLDSPNGKITMTGSSAVTISAPRIDLNP